MLKSLSKCWPMFPTKMYQPLLENETLRGFWIWIGAEDVREGNKPVGQCLVDSHEKNTDFGGGSQWNWTVISEIFICTNTLFKKSLLLIYTLKVKVTEEGDQFEEYLKKGHFGNVHTFMCSSLQTTVCTYPHPVINAWSHIINYSQ